MGGGSGGRGGGNFYVFNFLHVSEHSEHICLFVFCFFLVGKINDIHGSGVKIPRK